MSLTMFWCPKAACRSGDWGHAMKYCSLCGEETSAAPACVCGEPIHPRTHVNHFCEQCGQRWTGQFIGSRLSVVLGEQLQQVKDKLKDLV